jgi:surfeit locus 1 family protein
VPDAEPTEPGPVTWYLDNRTHKGMPGVHVLAVLPLAPTSASTTGPPTSVNDSAVARGAVADLQTHLPNRPDHVLLLRGWQLKDPQYPQGIRPGGKIQRFSKVLVRVESLSETRRAIGGVGKGVAGDQSWHWLGIDHGEMGRRAGISLLPVLLRQIEDATDLNNTRVDDGLVRSWVEPSEGVDKHRGYAFQWFLLAAFCVVLAVGLVWRALRPAKGILGAPIR